MADGGLSVTPRELRDVPAERLAFRFEPDVAPESLPEGLKKEETGDESLASIKADFETRRPADALLRTVVSPDGQRALALYGTSETDKKYDFRIDLYSSDGTFIRNVMPFDMTGKFASEVAWSSDGQRIAFIGVKNPTAQASPTPADATPLPDMPPPPGASGDETSTPLPTPTVAPLIQSVPAFKTEQIYVGDRDGYQLRPLTTREGLIYFQLAWSPDGTQLAALACKEDELNARSMEGREVAGRPRLIPLDGHERLLDDRLTDVAPVWSPDGSKVATAFDYDVSIYDAAGGTPTGASLPLRDVLYASSVEYEEKFSNRNGSATAGVSKTGGAAASKAGAESSASTANSQTGERVVNSFNPFVRLEWVEPETLFARTAFVRFYLNDSVTSYPRWHMLKFSPQAALVKG